MVVNMDKRYTVDGNPVRILCVDANDNDTPVVVLDKFGHVAKYTIDGKYPNYKRLNLVELPGTTNEEIERIFNSARDSGLTSIEALKCLLDKGVTMQEFAKWIYDSYTSEHGFEI
jgi:hypothetical protein